MQSVRTGKVDWTGDNPFIYLKTDPESDWSSLSVYFRIAASDYGRGHAIIVLENPYELNDDSAVRVCLTDNLELARYLVKDFISHFGLFRKAVALQKLEYVDDATFKTEADYPKQHIESTHSASKNMSINLIWNGLDKPFAVALPPAETQTGKHEMFCVFQAATSARVEVNGKAIPGQSIERDFLDRRAQSAALASSESWVQMS